MFINMPLLIKKFLDFVNEEYELVTKLKAAAPGTKNFRLPYNLEDHSILALADDPNDSKIFAELLINGDNVCLEYGDQTGNHDVCYTYNDYDDVTSMLHAAYTDWKKKVNDLKLSEEDISIDEFSKTGL